MAKRKAVRKSSSSKSGRGAMAPEPLKVIESVSTVSAPNSMLPRVLGFIVLIVIAVGAYRFFVAKHVDTAEQIASIPRAAKPVFAKELKLETLSKFDFKEDLWDLKADAQGNVYMLTSSAIYEYTSGSKVKTLSIGGAGARSMAFDGNHLYVTNFNNAGVLKVDKNLSSPGDFSVAGAKRLLGIAYSPHDGMLYVADVHGNALYVVDPDGNKKVTIDGPNSESLANGFASDVQADVDGTIYENDLGTGQITVFSPERKAMLVIPRPWTDVRKERVALCKGKIYVACYSESRILVMDSSGAAVGQMKWEHPDMISAGLDGFLYLRSGAKVVKLKPLEASTPATSAQAKVEQPYQDKKE